MSHLADLLRDPQARHRGRRQPPHFHQRKSVTLTSCVCPERRFRSAGRAPGTAAVPWGRCGVTPSLSWPYLRVLRRIRTPTLQTILVLTPCSQRLARTSRFWHCGSCCALMARHLCAMQLMLTFARRCWFPRVPAAVRDPTPEGCSHAHSSPQPSTVHPRHRSACIARLCTGT